MSRGVTLNDDHSVKTITARQYPARIWMYMQSNLKQSQDQAEKLKKPSDVKRKVNFRSSRVEAFINRKVSNQFVAIFKLLKNVKKNAIKIIIIYYV